MDEKKAKELSLAAYVMEPIDIREFPRLFGRCWIKSNIPFKGNGYMVRYSSLSKLLDSWSILLIF